MVPIFECTASPGGGGGWHPGGLKNGGEACFDPWGWPTIQTLVPFFEPRKMLTKRGGPPFGTCGLACRGAIAHYKGGEVGYSLFDIFSVSCYINFGFESEIKQPSAHPPRCPMSLRPARCPPPPGLRLLIFSHSCRAIGSLSR